MSNHDAELQPLHPQHHHRLPFCCYQAVVTTVTTCELFLHLPDLSPSSPGPRPCSVMPCSGFGTGCDMVQLFWYWL